MRPIDADGLGVGRCNPDVMSDPAYAAVWNGLIDIINNAPTIDPIHAAGGCYCRECRWGQLDDAGVMHCHKFHIHKKPGGYCDDGEAREAEDDG